MTISLGIITEQLQNYGGSEIYILECMRRWQRELDIVVYTTAFNPELFREFRIDEDKVSVQILEQVKSKRKRNRFRFLYDLVINPRIWERQVGQHDLYFQYLFPAQMVRKSPSIWFAAEPLRMLYDLRHHENTDSSITTFHVYPRMEYETASKSDLNVMLQIIEELDQNSTIENLVTNSQMMGGYLEAIYGRKADLIAYPGINLPDNWSGPANNKTALFVGRFWNHKRIELIIEALAMLPEGNLALVGDGAEKKRLIRLVQSLGLEQRVRFLGNLDNAQLDQLFRNVTCGIYTPVREPFGIVPIEAASHGLPVIVTPDGGYMEVLDSSCGHIVPPEPPKIAEALDSLFCNHDVAKQMGMEGRRRAEQFTWDHTASNLLDLFKQTLSSPRVTSSRPTSAPLLGAHYYPWYRVSNPTLHWNENTDYAAVSDLPLEGIYSSDDEHVIQRHLELAEKAGLDFLVVNLQVSGSGLDPLELRAVEALFDTAAEQSPELSLCFMISCDKADSASIDSAIAWLDENYLQRPNYLRLQSKPVLWFFITESFIGHFFYNFTRISQSTRHYHRIAGAGFCFSKCLPRHYGQFFDGWSLYSPLQVSESDKWESMWASSYQEFDETKEGEGLNVFTVCPGFDDTDLTQSQRVYTAHRQIARDDTATFIRMQEACLELSDPPDLVVVTSFNEFHENTQIEPSENFGYQYIEATRGFSEKLKAIGDWDPTETSDLPREQIKSLV